ncbi:hypothetical protein J6590_091692 [Homalodisca vitripennis]|nr:hypothetical protein J6590_091692 [Homalodisca vitripennis]
MPYCQYILLLRSSWKSSDSIPVVHDQLSCLSQSREFYGNHINCNRLTMLSPKFQRPREPQLDFTYAPQRCRLDRTISQGPAHHKHVAIDLYWNTANTPAWVCSDMREVLVTWCVSGYFSEGTNYCIRPELKFLNFGVGNYFRGRHSETEYHEFLRRPLTAIQLHTKKGYRRPLAVAQPRPTLTPLLIMNITHLHYALFM